MNEQINERIYYSPPELDTWHQTIMYGDQIYKKYHWIVMWINEIWHFCDILKTFKNELGLMMPVFLKSWLLYSTVRRPLTFEKDRKPQENFRKDWLKSCLSLIVTDANAT